MRNALTILILSSLVLTGCGEELEPVSLVTKFRVLGVQADPPEVAPGESTALRVLYANPDQKEIQAMWVGFRGLLTPSSSPNNIPSMEWPPIFSTIGTDYTGVAEYGDLFIRTDFLDDIEPNDYEANPCAEPNRTQSTVIVLLCAGGEIDMDSIGAAMSGSSGNADITSLFTGLCKGDNADSVLSFKTFMVSNPLDIADLPNTNPQIEILEFDNNELPPVNIAGDVGTFQCEGKDGCRDPINIRAKLTEESYAEYTSYYYDGLGNITSCEIIDERTYISWFSDGGQFDADRSGTDDPPDWYEVEWLPPRKGGEQFLWAVAHDLRGGVSWELYRLDAVPPQ